MEEHEWAASLFLQLFSQIESLYRVSPFRGGRPSLFSEVLPVPLFVRGWVPKQGGCLRNELRKSRGAS